MPTDAGMAHSCLRQPGGSANADPQPVLVLLLAAPTAVGKSLQPPGASTSSFPAHTARDLQGSAGIPACTPQCFSA